MTDTPRDWDLRDLLRGIPLFGDMEPAQLEHVAEHVRRVSLKRGDILFQKGDPSHGFYFVIEGQVKLALLSQDGAEKVVEILGPGMSFGEAVMLIDKPYPAYAECLQPARLLFVAREAVFQGIEEDAQFARKMLAGLSRRLHGLVKQIEDVTLHSSEQRVIGYLLREDLLGAEPGSVSRVKLPTSKVLIASRLNLSAETFSRVLHDLQETGLIRVEGRTITIPDLERLKNHGHRG